MKGFSYILISLMFLSCFGCDGSSSRRDASKFEFAAMVTPFASNIPAGFSQASDNSPQVCADETCPKIASYLNSRYFAEAAPGVMSSLIASDSRISSIKSRIIDHYAPCLEGGVRSLKATVTETHVIESQVKCFSNYSHPTQSEITTWGQILFGTSSGTDYLIDRNTLGSDLYTSTLWASQDESQNLDIWHSYKSAEEDSGTILSHLKSSTEESSIELAVGAYGSIGGTTPFACGVQFKFNASYLYISGKVAPTSSGSCDDQTAVTLCLNTTDFSSEAVANCSSLTTFSLTAIVPSDLIGETLSDDLNVDHSDAVTRFELEGLEEL